MEKAKIQSSRIPITIEGKDQNYFRFFNGSYLEFTPLQLKRKTEDGRASSRSSVIFPAVLFLLLDQKRNKSLNKIHRHF
jgi:hypothetical protein